jgi:hypothetical protein
MRLSLFTRALWPSFTRLCKKALERVLVDQPVMAEFHSLQAALSQEALDVFTAEMSESTCLSGREKNAITANSIWHVPSPTTKSIHSVLLPKV